jgi:7-keto-8-aminopelargonate synthetase-like enzyme
MTTGNLSLYNELERALARFFGVEEATLTSCGYLAPLVAAQAVAEDHTHVLLDERAHACLVDAALLTGLPNSRFPHRDPEGLRTAVRKAGPGARALVMTDGLFTHSGEVAPLDEYLRVLPRSSTLLVDDAHGVGVLGSRGRGTAEYVKAPMDRLIVAATLSKAFGSYGGVVLGIAAVRKRILATSRILTGNTSVPPPCAMAALAAIDVMRTEGPARRARLVDHVRQLKEGIRSAGGTVGTGPGPMFSLAPEGRTAVERLRRLLLGAHIHPPHIRYPNGPAPRYFRFAISSEHEPAQLKALGGVIEKFLRN